MEVRLPAFKKRFYGTIIDRTYLACVAVGEGTDMLDLRRRVVPLGRHAVGKIADWEQHRDAMAPTVAALRRRPDFDATRRLIEFCLHR